jgi:NhaP-type Na+/H+ or K+/H+ antiporter
VLPEPASLPISWSAAGGLALTYAVALVLAVLISERARSTVLSVAVLFLAAGIGFGRFLPHAAPHAGLLELVTDLALFSVLFSDGMRTGGWRQLRSCWRIIGRSLGLGMPLTILILGWAAHALAGFAWRDAFLLASALSPTDPVFVAAIFRNPAAPESIQHALNLESGFNDGLALPLVILFMATASARNTVFSASEELLLGAGLGIAIPWLVLRLEGSRYFGASGRFQPLNAFAIGLVILVASGLLHANIFWAGFAAGIAVADFGPRAREAFHQFGELIAELLKLAALLIFGLRAAAVLFRPLTWGEIGFIVLALFAARIAAMQLALLGSQVPPHDRIVIGWFGPKGFSSVVYALMIFDLGTPVAHHLARLAAVTIALSIVVYSSTDILVVRWWRRHQGG